MRQEYAPRHLPAKCEGNKVEGNNLYSGEACWKEMTKKKEDSCAWSHSHPDKIEEVGTCQGINTSNAVLLLRFKTMSEGWGGTATEGMAMLAAAAGPSAALQASWACQNEKCVLSIKQCLDQKGSPTNIHEHYFVKIHSMVVE